MSKFEVEIDKWKWRPLSQADRLVMIKNVLKTCSIYVMACYKFPTHFRENGTWVKGKIAWDASDTIWETRWLGCQLLTCFDNVLFAKQCWCLVSNSTSTHGGITKGQISSSLQLPPLKKGNQIILSLAKSTRNSFITRARHWMVDWVGFRGFYLAWLQGRSVFNAYV